MAEPANESRRLRVLTEMGIDVWVRRDRRPVERRIDGEDLERPTVPATRPLASAAAARPPAVAADVRVVEQSVASLAPVTVDLTAVAGGGALVVSAVNDAADRKIVQGVFMAIAGGGCEPQATRFVWPQPGLVDAGAKSMQIAYRAFLKGQASRARAATIVLLGAVASDMLGGHAFDAADVITGPDPSALRLDPDAKRTLWQTISSQTKA